MANCDFSLYIYGAGESHNKFWLGRLAISFAWMSYYNSGVANFYIGI